MSQKDLTQFLHAALRDSTLQDQLRAEGADPVAIAKEAGFDITVAELKNGVVDLPDEELESIAGGGYFGADGQYHAVMTGIGCVPPSYPNNGRFESCWGHSDA